MMYLGILALPACYAAASEGPKYAATSLLNAIDELTWDLQGAGKKKFKKQKQILARIMELAKLLSLPLPPAVRRFKEELQPDGDPQFEAEQALLCSMGEGRQKLRSAHARVRELTAQGSETKATNDARHLVTVTAQSFGLPAEISSESTPPVVVTTPPAAAEVSPSVRSPAPLPMIQLSDLDRGAALQNSGVCNDGIQLGTLKSADGLRTADVNVILKYGTEGYIFTTRETRVFELLKANDHLPGSENVITCFGKARSNSGRPIFVLERMYTNLLHLLRMNRPRGMHPEDVKDIARQIASGLAHLHELEIIHTDLKPENILVSYSGTFHEHGFVRPRGLVVKIADFGSSEIGPSFTIPDREEITTRNYRSLEAMYHHLITEKTDVWSFGCILAELISGRTLFDSPDLESSRDVVQVLQFEDVLGIRRRPKTRFIREPLEVEFAAYPEFLAILKATLTENPADRPSAAELWDRIGALGN
jgi:Protein kinase domain